MRLCAVAECDKPPRTGSAELCHMHYYRQRRHGDVMVVRPNVADPIERFWANVDRSDPDGCWPWTGSVDKGGYGKFSAPGRPHLRANRYALELKLGRPLEGWALHTCDNPPCCRGDHLYEGDHPTNVADKVVRDRQARGPELAAAIREGWGRTGYLRRRSS